MMDEHELIRFGMFMNELERLREKYGFWLQSAEVYSLTQADPLAAISAGSGEYTVTIENRRDE
jgi:hypothetical protein